MWLLLDIFVFSIFTVFLLNGVKADRPLVKTEAGQVEGVWQTSAKGLKYAAFLGIPYAKPPIGELRFEPPVRKQPWSEVLDAGDYGPFCMAYEYLAEPDDRVIGQEDCLYLNIFTPTIPQENVTVKESFDVIFYIHGGAFMHGRSNFYGAKFLMDRKVILVTINYRIGPFGFLSFEDEFLPGNNGLRDQRMALKWVQQHISKFSGNPDRVTIMGQSAGGASVHYHLLSPGGKDLFRNAISVSGTATCPWALVENARERALKLAKSVNCTMDTGTQDILDCLKDKPAGDLMEAVGKFLDSPFSAITPFGPVIEHKPSIKYSPFIRKAPLELMLNGKQRRLPWMVGVVEAEGLVPVASFIAKEEEMKKLDEDFDELVPQLLDYYHTVKKTDRLKVTKQIRKEYFRCKKVSNETANQLIKMVSDRLYVLDAQNAAKIQSKFSPVYFYKIGRSPSVSFSDVLSGTMVDYGVSQLDDHTYFMNMTFFPDYNRTADEELFSEQILDLGTSFVKNENSIPKSKGVCWKRLNGCCDFNFLNLDGHVPTKMAVDDYLGNAKFWTSLPINESTQRKYRRC